MKILNWNQDITLIKQGMVFMVLIIVFVGTYTGSGVRRYMKAYMP